MKTLPRTWRSVPAVEGLVDRPGDAMAKEIKREGYHFSCLGGQLRFTDLVPSIWRTEAVILLPGKEWKRSCLGAKRTILALANVREIERRKFCTGHPPAEKRGSQTCILPFLIL
mmetsp:Transcript_6012/g.14523  ORF Transcript_6012/g.14523 Transcript_6012/m.14523 type:complete len:114 (-) Transcript_6012:237-578(-)